MNQRGRRKGKRRRQKEWRKEETEEERRELTLVCRTGYYTFLKTHIHHAGAHHLNEVILVFLIRLMINYLDVNYFAVDGKISIINKEQSGGPASQDKKRKEKETVKRSRKVKVCPNTVGTRRRVTTPGPLPAPLGSSWASCGFMA